MPTRHSRKSISDGVVWGASSVKMGMTRIALTAMRVKMPEKGLSLLAENGQLWEDRTGKSTNT